MVVCVRTFTNPIDQFFCILMFFVGKENGPKTTNDMKLINAGKILENDKTLAESRVAVGELPGGVITMHVIVRPLTSDKASARQPSDPSKNNGCGCTIL
jgi:hypothetical protein